MAHTNRWIFNLGIAPTTPPVLVGDVLVAGTSSKLCGIDIYTGSARWPAHALTSGGIGPCAYAGNRLYFLGNVIDFAPVSNSAAAPPANQKLPGGLSGGGGNGGGGFDKSLIVLDAGTGKPCPEWAGVVPDDAELMDPVVESGVLILRTTKGQLSAYDVKVSGKPVPLWTLDAAGLATGSGVAPGPAGLGDNAAFFVIDGVLLAVNVRSGEIRWRFPERHPEAGMDKGLVSLHAGDSLPEVSAPMAGNGLVVVVGLRAAYALHWRTGEIVWTRDVPSGDRFNVPVVSYDGDTIFFTTRDGRGFCHILSTGEQINDSTLQNLTANGGFLDPVIDVDVVNIDAESGHLRSEDRVFLPARDGTVVIMGIDGDHTGAAVRSAKQYTITEEDRFVNSHGLAFAPLTGNGTLFLTDKSGKITAVSFSATTAPYFDGDSRITLPARAAYRFHQSDFTLELWLRTTAGGDVLTQSPSGNDGGFRLTVVNQPDAIMSRHFGEGCVQFTLFDSTNGILLFAQTKPTVVSDGTWHHVAVRRRGNGLVILVDGLSQAVNTLIHRSLVSPGELTQLPPATQRKFFSPTELSQNIAIASTGNADQPIVIGNYAPASQAVADDTIKGFSGLIADVRLWSLAVSATHLRNRMTKLLTGHEPGLIGYWPLNQKSPGKFKDETNDRLVGSATVVCIPSNLELDESLFPYLLHDVESSWPYKERWTVRAEDAPKWSPTGSGEVVCFATDQAIYAIDAIHGSRKWGRDITRTSAPIADNRNCYFVENGTVLALDLERGHQSWFTDLAALTPGSGGAALAVVAPVLTTGCVVATGDGLNYYWLARGNGAFLGSFRLTSESPIPPLAVGTRVYLHDGKALYAIEDPTGTAATPVQLAPVAQVSAPVTGTACLAADPARVLLFDGRNLGAFDAGTLLPPSGLSKEKAFAWNPPALSVVTGIGLASPLDSIIVTTADGHVHFLEYGSGRQKTRFDQPGAFVFAPSLQGPNALCTFAAAGKGGRNGIFAFDLKTGQLRAIDITNAPPTGPAYVVTDTAFFGVDNNGAAYPMGSGAWPAGERLDGEALHSVVLGSTCALLRKPGDADVFVPDVDRAFASGLAEPDPGRNTFQDGSFTVECWANASSAKGGSLATIAPGVSPAGAPIAGFELAIDDAGCVIAQYWKVGSGSGFQSQPTTVLDGRWHHVAAVFRKNEEQDQQLCYLYVDGLPLTGVTHTSLASVPAAGAKRSLMLGGTGTTIFSGLLDEFRVWATWIPAAELLTRRNVRLRGDEPDLLACLFFDPTGVHDSGPGKLHAVDASGRPQLDLRLTDLNFTLPSYPYMTANSLGQEVVTQPAANGEGESITTAKYTTAISARGADGSPMAGTHIRVWASEPTKVSTAGRAASVSIGPAQSADFTLNAQGNIQLDLSNTNTGHSPALWIWADYMYPNERFHVSPVVESNRHVVIAPPHLLAQSTMLQDIAYSTGDRLGINQGGVGDFKIHDHADVTTIHTSFSAVSADGAPMAGTVIELWADRETIIEVEAQRYPISQENSQKFNTGPDGLLCITLHEDADAQGNLLDCPVLIARAGFMPRQSRFVVAPAENVGKLLSSVTGAQINGEESMVPGEGKKTLIGKLKEADPVDAAAKAPAIAALLNQMASMARKPASVNGQAAGAAAIGLLPHNGASQLPGHVLAADSVQSLHGSVYSAQHLPLTPDYMPSRHFVLSMNSNGTWDHAGFNTSAALDSHIAGLGLDHKNAADLFNSVALNHQNEAAGGFLTGLFDGLAEAWHAISEGVAETWNNAVHFIVKTWDEIKEDVGEIVHQVEVVLADATEAIGKWVVSTVKDLVEHVTAFLEKVWVAIKDIYNFLKSLFDWQGILDVHVVLRDTFNDLLSGLETDLKVSLPKLIDGFFDDTKKNIASAMGVARDGDLLDNLDAMRRKPPTGVVGTCTAETKGGKAQYLSTKMKNHGSDPVALPALVSAVSGTLGMPFGDLGSGAQSSTLNRDFATMIEDVRRIMDQPGGIAKLTIKEVLAVLDDVINIVLDLSEDLILSLTESIGQAIGLIREVLNYEIRIPFVAELYELITGSPLTLLDALSLLLAVPVHIVTATLGFDFDQKNVANDLAGHPMFGMVATGTNAAGISASGSLKFVDAAFLVTTVVTGLVTCADEVVQGELNLMDPEVPGNKGTGEASLSSAQAALGIFRHFLGMTAGALQFASRNMYVDVLGKTPWAAPTTYLALIGPILKLKSGTGFIQGLLSISNGAKFMASFGKLALPQYKIFNKAQNTPVALIATLVGIGLVGWGIYTIVNDVHNNASSEFIAEDVIGIIAAFSLSLSFLGWSRVCIATEVDGFVLSAIALGGISLVSQGIATPVIHVAGGFGKAIL